MTNNREAFSVRVYYGPLLSRRSASGSLKAGTGPSPSMRRTFTTEPSRCVVSAEPQGTELALHSENALWQEFCALPLQDYCAS